MQCLPKDAAPGCCLYSRSPSLQSPAAQELAAVAAVKNNGYVLCGITAAPWNEQTPLQFFIWSGELNWIFSFDTVDQKK